MIFDSVLPLPPLPRADVFSYIFRHGRQDYPKDRVLYRVDGTEKTLTLGQLEQQSLHLARSLKAEYQIQPQCVVAIFSHDLIQYPIAYFGCLAAGATVALIPVQKQQNETDIVSHLKLVNAKLILTDQKLLSLTEKALAQYREIPVLTLDRGSASHPNLEDILTETRCYDDSHFVPVFELTTNDQAEEYTGFINRTSGSTGSMKSVLVSHAHFIATMEATRLTVPSTTNPDEDVWISPLSLGFFINAKLNMGLNILLGIPVVLMGESLESSNIDVIPRHRITFIFVAPPLAAKLAYDRSDIDLSSVKWILSAGSPISKGVRDALSCRFGGLPLTMEWASAETMLLTIQTEDESSRQPGSSGTLVNGVQAKVIDTETGSPCGVGEPGELYVRNRLARFKGYKDNEVANRAFTSDGWFQTGDYGYLDEKCNVYIVDRIKELIKVGEGYGSHVSAADLEGVVFGHPAVGSVVVVGCRDEAKQLDRPTAFVVLKPEFRERTEQVKKDIERFAAEGLTGLQSLSGGIRCIDQIPVTGFKINRRALRNMA
ncbi:AMP-dependent synthetase/ligase [Penicillium vulpinum]|uniref:AMP-dependent synthetase/ligase domain-containing protein n=1 Tax=Penicillium vulpinum TaxID=29845 RepID=A0A1V6RGN2_9EURO|nr:AMP-dependent synthetase/ligase [Penicillium vulpinum]KAJ5959213.1 AMP-dependent synthetase/ligase [Penicillium vulpinum]OQE00654.1 hypothetical protein PENVUL_c048G08066 [Penicillium vulpinum]